MLHLACAEEGMEDVVQCLVEEFKVNVNVRASGIVNYSETPKPKFNPWAPLYPNAKESRFPYYQPGTFKSSLVLFRISDWISELRNFE